MVTSLNTSVPARDYITAQLVHYLRKAINVATTPTATVVTVGTIPAGAIVLGGLSGVYVQTDLTGTTNLLDIGYAADAVSTADANAYASALVLASGGGFTVVDELGTATARARTLPATITATWTGTATTGAFDVVIAFAPDR